MRVLVVVALLLLGANLAWLAWRGLEDRPWQRTATAAVERNMAGDAEVVVSPALPDRHATAASPVATTDAVPPGTTASPPAMPVAIARTPAPPPPAARVAAPASGAGLLLPVQGIRANQLQDTFGDARSGERMHEALDIMAPAGTPVLAAADGHVEKLFTSDRGGLTIYQFEPSGTRCYYYAHLQSYAPGLKEGKAVKRGEVIGYVGSTGNATPAAPHLHFAVFALTPEKQWWKGTPLNPYPLLGGTPKR